MFHKISTLILAAILANHTYRYYQQWSLQQSIENYQANKGYKRNTKTQRKIFSFNPQIIKVTNEIYVAYGYAMGNSILLIGESGCVIIDTTETITGAQKIANEFRKITNKPIKGIIYTHNHGDHVLGTESFLANHTDRKSVQIWAHHTLMEKFFQSTRALGQSRFYRAMHQFGVFLKGKYVSAGIGDKLLADGKTTIEIIPPNKLLYKDKQTIHIAGMELVLMHIPGETDDQICVYWPDKKALLGSDNLYKAFPNLYAIRGTQFRSLKKWYESLDKMRNLRPRYAAMSHLKPIIGEEEIYNTFTNYRDAVQFVHDQTVRFINEGLHPDEIADRIELPIKLRNHPYLQELYGTVKWSSKGLFSGYMGWFSGDIAELDPLTPNEKAKRLVKLAGGIENLLDNSEKSHIENDPQWSLYLSSAAVRIDSTNTRAKELKAKALLDMAERQTSFNGYNYYATCAYATLGAIKVQVFQKERKAVIRTEKMDNLLHLLASKFQPEKCSEMDKVVLFVFPDTKQENKFHIRNGVVDLSGIYTRKEDVKVTMDSVTWRELLAGEKSGLLAAVASEITAEPGIFSFREIMSCFS